MPSSWAGSCSNGWPSCSRRSAAEILASRAATAPPRERRGYPAPSQPERRAGGLFLHAFAEVIVEQREALLKLGVAFVRFPAALGRLDIGLKESHQIGPVVVGRDLAAHAGAVL